MLGFIPINDNTTATLVNPKTRESRVFSCYPQFTHMTDRIYSNHFNVTPKGFLYEVAYPEVLVKISQETPITFKEFITSPEVQIQLFETLVNNDAKEESLLKYVCDICNVSQTNIYKSTIFRYFTIKFPASILQVTNLQVAVKDKYLQFPTELLSLLDVGYSYHWIFID